MRPGRGRRRALTATLAGALALWSTLALAQTVDLRDDAGHSLHWASPPQRIVSLLPSLTETVWVLGGGERLVGVDRYSNWPPALADRPRLGGLEDAQIESIVALRPQVVLAAAGSRALERLEALGVPVLRLRSDTHADVRRTLDIVARLLGRPAEGERTWTRLQQQIDAAAARVPAAWRGQRAYFEVGGGPYAAGAGSFIGETLGRLGLGNIVPPELGPFPKLNPEFVVRARPDLILGVQRELDMLPQRPGWAALPAVQQRRWCGFDSAQYDMLVRPGPRLGEAAGLLADCLRRLPPPARPAGGGP